MTGQFYNRHFKHIFSTENYVTKQKNVYAQNVFNPTLLITHNIFNKHVFWFCYISSNTPLTHGYGTIYVYFSVFPARCQVTLPLRLLKFSYRILKFILYFGPEEFKVRESTKVTLLLLQLCTLQSPKLPVKIFHFTATFEDKKK